jgi:tRNA(Ile)-lysidine synthase
MTVLERVRLYIEEQTLLTPGAAVVVGVSGGPDSLCLLDLLQRLSGEWRLSLHVAHLNHNLRPEAAAEAELVRAEAERRDLPFHTETADVRAHAHHAKQSIEEAARHLRYDFLARVARAAEASLIAVAHTADDQAETVLMHFLRGSGLAGLRGMRPKLVSGKWDRDTHHLPLTIIRPLLLVSRSEVEAYCAERGLRPVHDPTNADTTYFRNRLRHELLPELETYNPNIRAALGRMAEVAAGEHELLGEVVEALWKRIARAGLQVEFDRERWLTLTVPEQRALLRRAIHYLRAAERDVDFAPLERAVRFSRRAGPGRRCEVLGGLQLKITAAAIILRDEHYQPVRAETPLLDERGQLAPEWRFIAEHLAPGAWSLADATAWRVYVDAALLAGPLHVRGRFPGDRFQPLGLGGHRVKLSDFMINAKVDEALRDRWPLVVCGEDIVWVAGLRVDERYKVTEATQSVLCLTFIKTE